MAKLYEVLLLAFNKKYAYCFMLQHIHRRVDELVTTSGLSFLAQGGLKISCTLR